MSLTFLVFSFLPSFFPTPFDLLRLKVYKSSIDEDVNLSIWHNQGLD